MLTRGKVIFSNKFTGGSKTKREALLGLGPSSLSGMRAHFRLGQSTFAGITKHQCTDSEPSRCWVEFDSRRHADKFVDLELPNAVSSGEHSWWGLDGYETNEDEDEDEAGEDP